ncbi:MAG TPA: hypothetical protein VES97_06305 [Solirubrobacteraceae bacterium]|nr:hypothetical protein [Solirubrobacteraceae bacterium]
MAALDLLLGGRDALAEVFGDRAANLLAFCLAERDRGVVGFDGCFDEVDGLVALRAFAALVARADEVLVESAVAFVS